MNLAEIRKKAQQAKGAQQAHPPLPEVHISIPEELVLPQVSPPSVTAGVERPALTAEVIADFDSLDLRSVAVPPPSPSPGGFDPLAILLAGRESAGVDDQEGASIQTGSNETVDEDIEEYF